MHVIQDLLAAGASDAQIRRIRRTATRIRRGVYTTFDADPWVKYATECRAALRVLRPGAVLAGPSAASLWGLPLVGDPPSQVFVRGITRGSYGAGLKVVAGGHCQMAEHRGVPVASVSWTVADCARLLSRRDALIVADAALHLGLCTLQQLKAVAHDLRGAKGVGRLRWIIANADPLSESPGETWTRMVVKELGYSVTSQVVVIDGDFEARLDLLLDGSRVVLEFDGAIKYGPVDEESNEPEEVARRVMREKERQAKLEALEYICLRVIWSQLDAPSVLDKRIRTAMGRLEPFR